MKNHRMNDWFEQFGTKILIRFRWLVLLIIFLLLFMGFLGTKKITMDSSNESFFAENDETIALNNYFKEIFGSEEFVFILIEANDVFSPDVLAYIRQLSNDIEKRLPFVKEVTSLTSIEFTEAIDDELIIEDLIGSRIPHDLTKLETIRKKALSKELFINRLLTEDCQHTGIIVNFERIPEHVWLKVNKNFSPVDQANWPAEKIILADNILSEQDLEAQPDLSKIADARKLIAPALEVILQQNTNPDINVYPTGLPVLDYGADKIILAEGGRIGLIALVIAVLFLTLIFRNPVSVIAPVIVVIATLVSIFGICGWFGITMNLTSIVIVPLILVISVSYSVHVINHYRYGLLLKGDQYSALAYMFAHAGWPCLVTSLTTIIGFASFLLVPIKPIRNMGIICALGVLIAYLLVITLVPIFHSFSKRKRGSNRVAVAQKTAATDGWMIKLSRFSLKHAAATGMITALLLLLIGFFTSQVVTDSQMTNMLGKKVDFVKNANYVGETLGSIYSFEFLVELPEPDMAKNPEVLKTLEEISNRIETWEEISLTLSLADMIKDLNKTMNSNQNYYYAIPDNQALIAQYLLLYEMSGGENLTDWVDYDFKTLRLTVQATEFSTTFTNRFEQLVAYGHQNFPEGTQVNVTGDLPIMLKIIKQLSLGQVLSIFIAALVISVFMMVILGSVKAGLLSMIPNLLPIGVISCLMGIFHMSIDLITVMIAPMIIGIAVDDTVHYFIHFQQEYLKTGSYKKANDETFKKVGSALIFTSVIISSGFLVFSFSNIASLKNMAFLSAAGILTALVADLLITPAIFVFTRPFKKQSNFKQKRKLINQEKN
ncbi:MAG: MMPL family transporter [Spirochaetes bacterium]|nr:MMPL family transporter [Spirochaetota bacterium]